MPKLPIPVVLLALLVEFAIPVAALPAAERPNIVLILADDLGYGDPGCYNSESKVPTPHLDRLAAEGMLFTDAHCPSSVCTPTRYGLLTGRYCWRTELKQSVLWPWDAPLIEPDRLTLPKMLKKVGYQTACIGKWHLGWNWPTRDGSRINDTLPLGRYDVRFRTAFSQKIDFSQPIKSGPLAQGFDSYFGDDVPNFPPYIYIENDRVLGIPSEPKPAALFGHPGPMLPGWDLSGVMPALAAKAVEFIEEARRAPFFLYMPLTAPHTPIAPRPEFVGKSGAGRYGDYVAQVDGTVGQILAALDRNGLRDDTLVLFTSDNGSPARDGTNMAGPTRSVVSKYGHDPSRPWRGMKSDIWEGGHRVPFIIRWPGHVAPNTRSEELICLTDCFATFAALVGQELPNEAGEDSLSFLPVLEGRENNQPLRGSLVHHSGNGTFAIRKGNWKLIVDNLGSGGFTKPAKIAPKPDGPQGQLYNLAADPAEQHNLWDERADVVEQLRNQLEHILRDGRSRPNARH